MRLKTLCHTLWPAILLLSMGASYKGCVFDPTDKDIITTLSKMTIQGTISEFNENGKWRKNHHGIVRLKRNGTYITGWRDTQSGTFKFEDTSLLSGINTFGGQVRFQNDNGHWITADIPEFLVERKTDLTSRGEQKVYFDLSDTGIDDQIKEMAKHTLNHSFTSQELDDFVTDVKNRITSFFIQSFRGHRVVLVNNSGKDIHTIKFYGEDRCDLYGQSPGDYKNQNKEQTSKIYVGTFKCVVVDYNRLLNRTAATKNDTLDQRVNDLGVFIGRTVVHELGHSLGLTNEQHLHGCEGTHNCEDYDSENPSDRFDNGHYIMDPGPKSTIWARIGQDNGTERRAKLPRFNSYNKSYLNIIH